MALVRQVKHMMTIFPIIVTLLAATTNFKNHIRTGHLQLQQIRREDNSVVWVDVENVRGKSGFELSHDEALQKVTAWTKFHNLVGKVIFAVDHGSVQEAYNYQDVMSIVFAGPSEKADDVIAHGVHYFDRSLVITADFGLQQRCRRASKNLHIMDPAKFLDDLELVPVSVDDEIEPVDDDDQSEKEELSLEQQVNLGRLDDEIRLRGQILDCEIQMHKKKTMTKKRRKKLQTKIDRIRKQLSLRGPSLLEEITSIESSSSDTTDSAMKGILLSRWKEIQTRAPRREQTGDRVVYAEQLRRQIMDDNAFEVNDIDEDVTDPAKSFLMHVNGISRMPLVRPTTSGQIVINKSGKQSRIKSGKLESKSHSDPDKAHLTLSRIKHFSEIKIDSLDIVAVSDTHGFEGQLIVDPESSNDLLPDGDILIHLGDFARDGSKETQTKGLVKFDSWLARQPHKYKIVVRGNHDPWTCEFTQSGAWYVTKPTSTTIGGFVIGMIPHGSARTLNASGGLPKSCDILLSHVPPYKCLDRTFSNKHAGSQFITKTVRNMKDKTPRLWLCGHIHEARGTKRQHFGKRETLVVNAANANAGRGTHIEHGPVTIRMECDEDVDAEILNMESNTIEKRHESSSDGFFDHSQDGISELLLSIDLGLKSGIALFSSDGCLLRYEQFLFNKDTLEADAKKIIQEWETVEGEDSENDEGKPTRITHIAIEGGDTIILDSWTKASPDLSILRVSPEEWRSEMLMDKEKSSGSDSKAAARLIARQLVSDIGSMEEHQGKFPTDVAEAVAMGSYVASKLGWLSRNPLVRRYTNGNIVVPKKVK